MVNAGADQPQSSIRATRSVSGSTMYTALRDRPTFTSRVQHRYHSEREHQLHIVRNLSSIYAALSAAGSTTNTVLLNGHLEQHDSSPVPRELAGIVATVITVSRKIPLSNPYSHAQHSLLTLLIYFDRHVGTCCFTPPYLPYSFLPLSSNRVIHPHSPCFRRFRPQYYQFCTRSLRSDSCSKSLPMASPILK
jgi:hypothetical protein